MRAGFLLTFSMLLFPAVGHPQVACLTTLPPNPPFAPPAPYDSVQLSDNMFWYGTDAFWTQLSVEGVWHTKGNSNKRGGYDTKLIFWKRGFDWRKELEPELIVTARRLDHDSPSVAVAHANAVFITGNTPAMMTGISIPTAGCWEVVGQYRGHTLTFIVSVEP